MRVNQSLALRLSILACITAAGVAGNSAASEVCEGTNTCFGDFALVANTTGQFNSAFGNGALTSNTTGLGNSAFGFQALERTGVNPLPAAFIGSWNTAIGMQALHLNIFGSDNTATGAFALSFSVNGTENTAHGSRSLSRNFSGDHNTAAGVRALESNVDGSNNTASGTDALRSNVNTWYNTATGYAAMLNAGGGGNTAFGAEALAGYTIGADSPNKGALNTAVGWFALANNDSGSNNTAGGYSALAENISGASNTAIGVNALSRNTTGVRNTAHGTGALRNNIAGARNVGLGYQAGFAATGSDNIIIGGGNNGKAADNGVIRIGTSAYQKKAFIAGIRGVTTGLSATAVFIDGNGQLGTIKSSRRYKEDIQAMGDVSDRLLKLRPVAFHYKEPQEDGSKPMQFGLVAEEVAEAFPELVIHDERGEPETVAYHLLATLLLNEFQEQATRIATLEKQSDELVQLKQEFAQMTQVIERLDRAAMVAATR